MMYVCFFSFANPRDGCDADSCTNIVENCIDDGDDVKQGTYTLVCKYGVIGLACLNMLREVAAHIDDTQIYVSMCALKYILFFL